MDSAAKRRTALSNSEPNSVAEWLDLDRRYRIKGRYDITRSLSGARA